MEGTVNLTNRLARDNANRVERLERDVISLVNEDKIAKEVARRVNASRKVTLSRLQTLAVFITVACSVGGLALGIVAALAVRS